jgi:hypothetical protein
MKYEIDSPVVRSKCKPDAIEVQLDSESLRLMRWHGFISDCPEPPDDGEAEQWKSPS